MRMLELKDGQFRGDLGAAIPLELDSKAVTEEGEFEGYAAIYGNRDLGDDIVQAGAFDESLRERPAGRVKMLWQHDTRKPIGVWREFVSDSKGLFCRGKLLLTTVGGKEAHEFMKAGAIDSLSIGYRTREYRIDRENGVRIIEKAELMEVSAVTFPMNPEARIAGVKGEVPDIRTLERVLKRDAGLSASQAKALLASGYSAIHDERDAGTDGDEAEGLKRLAELFRS
ncbi:MULTISPECIES: HK97 family phage prohead protease [Hyphobacterium]|uniref:HK97 family phage prohead protease n=1 Tax=Hyphobacterium vulgare TaxID=1736751 RepID=A0ABV6ZU80_9PROT